MDSVFVLSVLSLVLLCSLLIYHLPAYVPTDGTSRLLFGCCLSPYVLASYVGIMRFCCPFVPNTAYASILLLISSMAIVTIVYKVRRPYVILKPQAVIDQVKRQPLHYITLMVSLACFAILLWYWQFYAHYILQQPIHGHDSNVYFAQALNFTQTRQHLGLTQFDAPPGQLASGHPHSFFFELLLAFGLMVHPNKLGINHIVYHYDLPAKLLVLLCCVSVLLAIVNLARQLTKSYLAVIACLIVFFVPMLYDILEHLNRDSFRLLAFMLPITLLLIYIKQQPRVDITLRHVIFFSVVNAFSLWAHMLNIVFMPCIVLMSLPFFVNKQSVKKLVSASVVFALITMLALMPYWYRWYHYGTLLVGMNYLNYTPTILAALKHYHLAHLPSMTQSLTHYLFFPSLIGLGLSAAFIVVFAKLLQRNTITNAMLYLSLTYMLLVCIPFAPHVWGSISLRQAFLTNFRYVWQIEILSPIVIVCGAQAILTFLSRKKFQLFISMLVMYSAISLSFYGLRKLHHIELRAVRVDTIARHYYIAPLVAAMKHFPSSSNWLTDYTSVNYFIKNKPIFLYSITGKSLLTAPNRQALFSVLKRWKVTRIVFYATTANIYLLQHSHSILYQVFAPYLTQKNLSGVWYIFDIDNNQIKPVRIR